MPKGKNGENSPHKEKIYDLKPLETNFLMVFPDKIQVVIG
jgi:hypothetical protein